MNYFFSFTHLKKTYIIRHETSKKRIKKFFDDSIITLDEDPEDIADFIYLDRETSNYC